MAADSAQLMHEYCRLKFMIEIQHAAAGISQISEPVNQIAPQICSLKE